MQLIPGHEFVGRIVQLGKSVKGLSVGDRCVADNTLFVSYLFSSKQTW
jgi:D-arabinitol dehydrogenase (NADP+)